MGELVKYFSLPTSHALPDTLTVVVGAAVVALVVTVTGASVVVAVVIGVVVVVAVIGVVVVASLRYVIAPAAGCVRSHAVLT